MPGASLPANSGRPPRGYRVSAASAQVSVIAGLARHWSRLWRGVRPRVGEGVSRPIQGGDGVRGASAVCQVDLDTGPFTAGSTWRIPRAAVLRMKWSQGLPRNPWRGVAIVTLFAKHTQLLGDVLRVLLEHTVIIPGGPRMMPEDIPACICRSRVAQEGPDVVAALR